MADNFKDLRAKLEKAAAAKKTEQPKAAEKNVKPAQHKRPNAPKTAPLTYNKTALP